MKKPRRAHASAVVETSPDYQSFLQQAEVCREQAGEAARMRRFGAALGLFETAASLCRQAISVGGDSAADAAAKMRAIRNEQAAYLELSKSLKRPLLVGVPARRGERGTHGR